jgi:hypothetical protein
MVQDTIVSGTFAILGVIVGVVTTHFLSKARWRTERLTEGIYRPLLGTIGRISETIREGGDPNLDSLKKARYDGLYFVMDRQVRELSEEAYSAIREYKDAVEASRASIDTIVRQQIDRFAKGEDVEKFRSGGHEVNYRAFIDHQYMGSIELRDCLLIGRMPSEILIER